MEMVRRVSVGGVATHDTGSDDDVETTHLIERSPRQSSNEEPSDGVCVCGTWQIKVVVGHWWRWPLVITLYGVSSPHTAVAKPSSAVLWLCHAALVVAQASLVMGAVYFKACLQQLDPSAAAAFHPIRFVLFRCALATPILLCAAKIMTGGCLPQRHHMGKITLLGLFLFLNQGLFIVGLQHAGALLASCIQPAIPTWTHLLAVLMGVEQRTWQGTAGVVVAMLGAACMVWVSRGWL